MTTYARKLGLFSATMAVVGGIIGSGIFRNPAEVVSRVRSPALTLAAWGIGAAIALAGAFCFAELGARKPRAGGGYVYLRDAFGPLPAFLYAWALLLIIATGAMAGVAMTFAGYATALVGLPGRALVPLAVAAIALLSAINVVGVKPGAVTQNVLTVLKLAGLALLIGAGVLVAAPAAHAAPGLAAPDAPAAAPTGFAAFVAVGSALVPVLFSYGGWQQTNYIAEEIIDPDRNLPRALTLGVLVVVAVYLAANVVYLHALGPAELAVSTAPAAEVVTRLVGPLGGKLIGAAIACSTFGFLGLVIMVTPRVYQAMAADGLFLPQLARLHPVYRTPSRAIVLQAVWSIVLALSGSYGRLVDYVVFGDWIFFGLTVATLFVYRARARRSHEPRAAFETPGYPLVPALFVVAAAYVVISSIAANPGNALIGGLILAAGVPVFHFSRRVTAS